MQRFTSMVYFLRIITVHPCCNMPACSWGEGPAKAGQAEACGEAEQAGGVWVCVRGPRHGHGHKRWQALHVWKYGGRPGGQIIWWV